MNVSRKTFPYLNCTMFKHAGNKSPGIRLPKFDSDWLGQAEPSFFAYFITVHFPIYHDTFRDPCTFQWPRLVPSLLCSTNWWQDPNSEDNNYRTHWSWRISVREHTEPTYLGSNVFDTGMYSACCHELEPMDYTLWGTKNQRLDYPGI